MIHLQDLHSHPEVQMALSHLVGHLHKTLGINLVAHEGADGFCDTTPYSDLPDPASTERIARLFLHEGLLTGTEYYGITHPGEVTIWGVEEEATYAEHLRVYQRGAGQQAESRATLEQLRKVLLPLQTKHYPRAIQRLLKRRQTYEEGTKNDGLRPYLEELQQLARAKRLNLRPYKAVRAFVRLSRLWSTLDMNEIEPQRDQLLRALLPRLNMAERALLTTLAEAGGSTTSRSYFELDRLARAWCHGHFGTHSKSPTEYAAFRRYVTYLQRSQKTNTALLAEEIAALHEAVEEAHFTTPAQRALAQLLKQVSLLDDLIQVKLSPPRFQAYHQQRANLTADALQTLLQTVLPTPSVTRSQLSRLIDSLPAYERFYELAIKRDGILECVPKCP